MTTLSSFNRYSMRGRMLVSYVLLAFFVNTLVFPVPRAQAKDAFILPAPGVRVELSSAFAPAVLRGIKVYPDNPFRLDFILDKGNSKDSAEQLKSESTRLIKYFLASITVPEKDLWVNLSPYEKDRIIPEAFGITEMGRDLLAQDYILKQITASVIYPESATGKEFWDKVYAEAKKRYGTTDVPIDTFNKVWIVPEKAVVYENKDAAYVVESRLKVLLEEDYVALQKNAESRVESGDVALEKGTSDQGIVEKSKETNKLGSEIVREVVIPILEKEVNEGKNFVQLRQVYHSLILAIWYKDKIRESLLGKAYVDQEKTVGVDIEDKSAKNKIWEQYIEAFKKGTYNYIREDYDPVTQEVLPRKYFSGGIAAKTVRNKLVIRDPALTAFSPDVAEGEQQIIEVHFGTIDSVSGGMFFKNPQFLRNSILRSVRLRILDEVALRNKPTIYFSPTKFCPVNCIFCYYSSPFQTRRHNRNTTITRMGVEKFIRFTELADPAGLTVSGGGEPFFVEDRTLEVVKQARADRIVLVTSAFWASNKKTALAKSQKIFQAKQENQYAPEAVLRASVDEFHKEKISLRSALNIALVSHENRQKLEEMRMSLMFHSLRDDQALTELEDMLELEGISIAQRSKIEDIKTEIVLSSGMTFEVRRVDLLHPNTKIDLRDPQSPEVQRNLAVFAKKNSYKIARPDGRVIFGIHQNIAGENALDFSFNYDGLVELWGSGSPDNQASIYHGTYEQIRERLLRDVITVGHFNRGSDYLERILDEVNPIASIRAKAINVQEWYSYNLLREAKDRLYLSIRILQDAIMDKSISPEEIAQWPKEIQQAVVLSKEELIRLYHASSYSIIDQALDEYTGSVDALVDLYETIKMGHYTNVFPEQMESMIMETNRLSDLEKKDFFGKILGVFSPVPYQFYEYKKVKVRRKSASLTASSAENGNVGSLSNRIIQAASDLMLLRPHFLDRLEKFNDQHSIQFWLWEMIAQGKLKGFSEERLAIMGRSGKTTFVLGGLDRTLGEYLNLPYMAVAGIFVLPSGEIVLPVRSPHEWQGLLPTLPGGHGKYYKTPEENILAEMEEEMGFPPHSLDPARLKIEKIVSSDHPEIIFYFRYNAIEEEGQRIKGMNDAIGRMTQAESFNSLARLSQESPGKGEAAFFLLQQETALGLGNKITVQFLFKDGLYSEKKDFAFPLELFLKPSGMVEDDLKFVQGPSENSDIDPVIGLDKGGIDLTRDKMNIQAQGGKGSIQFKFNPAMIEQLQNTSGLTPVIINIRPMPMSVPVFLGVEDAGATGESSLK